LGAIVAAFAVGALVAHQLQVQGLWAPSLLAPDPGRLWTVGRGGGLGAGFERIAWAVIKAVLLSGVCYWAIRAEWEAIHTLSHHDFPAASSAAGSAILFPARILGVVLLLLGLADYVLRYFRFETMLRTTAQEQREDQRVMEGDVALRSKRRRLARAWRGDAPELLAGASLVLAGKGGLTVVLAGGPPPRRLTLRSIAQGATGLQLRRTAEALRVPQLDAPDLALRLARQASGQPAMPTPVPAELAAEFAAIWPAK
jgi:flagellar biosynthetic protein FlhB